MKKINLYLYMITNKYIFINMLIITILIIFLNLLEISRVINDVDMKLILILSWLKIPSIIQEVIPFVIVIAVSFLFRNLISNNELIAMRNIGFSIIDIFKPIGAAIFIIGLGILLFINPIAAKFERMYDEITNQKYSNNYSIKIINESMWIKNISDNNEKNFINISKIDLENMLFEDIKILNIGGLKNKVITAKEGLIDKKKFKLKNVVLFNINKDEYEKLDNLILDINFDKTNIMNSISNYKFIPFYKYNKHISSLKKFNLHSTEVSLFYISQFLKPIFLIIIGFTVMGFSAKFKRNENFFKILFISILIGFLVFLLNEVMINLSIRLNLSFIFSYFVILFFPLVVGLYQSIKVEND